MSTQEITVRARAFSNEGVREHRVMVEDDGTVRVWDSVAGHYTICHSLSQGAQARIRKLAEILVSIEIGDRLWSVTFRDGASYQVHAQDESEANRKARRAYRREFGGAK